MTETNGLYMSGSHDIHAFMEDRSSEERKVLLRAYWKGVSFECSVSVEESKNMTKTWVDEYIVSCLRNGKTLPELKAFWISRLEMYRIEFEELMESNPSKYVGKSMTILVGDIFERVRGAEGFTDDTLPTDICQWFMFKWILGIGCLLKLGLFTENDANNGFLCFSGPASLIDGFDNEMRLRATADGQKLEREAEPTPP